jgi:hypothetical protein
LTYTAIVPNPEFTGGEAILRATLPHQWSVIEDSQSRATRGLIGYAAGGDLDIPLRFDVAFDGAIDDMKPPTEKGCYHHGDPPYPAARVEDITAQTGDGTGFRKMGDRTAEYRVWQANCPNEMGPQIHQAWLLPDLDIGDLRTASHGVQRRRRAEHAAAALSPRHRLRCDESNLASTLMIRVRSNRVLINYG